MKPVNKQRIVVSSRCSIEPRYRSAFTLAELMIVVIIISVVTIATIPLLKPAMDSRRIREAARMVTTQFASAQSEAVASGHSVGVWLEKIHPGGVTSSALFNGGDASMDLYMCEAPEPYSGDSQSSNVNMTVAAGIGSVTIYNAFAPPGGGVDTAWIGLIRSGDLIRFHNSGGYYSLSALNGTTDSNGYFQPASSGVNTTFKIIPLDADDFDSFGNPAFRHLPPAAFTPAGWTTSYQIIRQPVRSAGTPMQLPSGALVDLYYSGMGNPNPATSLGGCFGTIPSFNLAADKNPVIVTFDRTGTLEYLYVGGLQVPVTSPIYFLIGKREQLPSLELDTTKQNWADQENLWVVLNPQSGLASAAEVAAPNSSSSTLGQQIINSRAFATSAQAMGGK